MNKFTKEFFAATFNGYKYEKLITRPFFWTNKAIPFVETTFELSVDSTYKWCLDNEQLLNCHSNQAYAKARIEDLGHSWFTIPHSHGWNMITLKGESLSRQDIVNPGEISEVKNSEQPLNYKIDLETELESLGFNLSYLRIVQLVPGGWAQPHVDPLYIGMTSTMNYFWIPLHDAAPSLKIYPYGLLQQKTGCMYWFNNASFVHSIFNDSDVNRYVAIGRINLKDTKMSLKDKIYQDYSSQWYN